jgi:tRNA1(Val) A37 N6-methylase TrmN6
MCELNKKNVLVCKQIFDINNEYKLNLYEGDTLEFKPFEIFKVKQFDVILGNPPYNKGGIRSHTGKQLGEKNETIWTKFIEKAFKWLKPDGYLVYINPLSWLKKSHSLHNIMLEKHIIWMKLWDD